MTRIRTRSNVAPGYVALHYGGIAVPGGPALGANPEAKSLERFKA